MVVCLAETGRSDDPDRGRRGPGRESRSTSGCAVVGSEKATRSASMVYGGDSVLSEGWGGCYVQGSVSE